MERVVSKHLFNYPLDGVIDAETEAYLNKLKESMPQEVRSMSGKSCKEVVAMIRQSMAAMDFKSHPTLLKASDECIHTRFEVPLRDGNDFKVPVLVHTPKTLEGQKDRAAMIYAHGGGCVAGDAEMMQSWLSHSAVASEIVIYNVDYRLAPETKCPKNLLDFYCAIKHITENAAEFGLDASKIGISGDSGGGYVAGAAMVMLAQKDESHLIKLGMLRIPMLDDYEFGDPASMTIEERENAPAMQRAWEAIATDLESQRRNPDPLLFPAKVSEETLTKFAPTIIFEMEFDMFITPASRFARRLRAAGRLFEFYVLPGAVHLSGAMFQFKISEQVANDYKLLLQTYLK